MKLSALSGLVLVLNGLWDNFSKAEKEQLAQDSSTWPPELQKKVDDLVSDLDSKR
jgi:serine/threonine protein phosphatase PrpC